MSRRTLMAMVTGAVLATGLAGTAAAAPAQEEGACIRLDSDRESREGVCVYLPITIPVAR